MVDLHELEKIVRGDDVWGRIHTALETARTKLQAADNDWYIHPLDINIFQGRLPDALKSCRITVFKPETNLKVERHPNATQYVRVIDGQTNFRVLVDETSWQANPISADADEIAARWSVVAPGVWHCPLPIDHNGWAVLGFHTVPIDDLLTEYPDE